MPSIRPRIPTPAEPVVDQQTGLMTVSWYDFFAGIAVAPALQEYPNDMQAAAGGVALFGLYRTGSTVKVRVT